MERLKQLFDFKGVAQRKEYWLTVLGIYGGIVLATTIFFLFGAGLTPLGVLFFPVYAALLVAFIVGGLAVRGRRLHDRGKSGWWLLVFTLLPSLLYGVGGLANLGEEGAGAGLSVLAAPFAFRGLIEMGFLPGRKAPNRYVAMRTAEAVAAFD